MELLGGGMDSDDDDGGIGADGKVMPRTLLLEPSGSGAAAASDSGKALCGLCSKQLSRYTCPRCSVRYCSLGCYKGDQHAECSEGFYKAEFMDAMKNKVADPKERKVMAGVLQKFEAEAAEAEADTEVAALQADLADRIQGLDLDDHDDMAEVWNRLTPQEQADFNNKQKLATLLVQWAPWWLDCDPPAKVEAVVDAADGSDSDGGGDGDGADRLARREVAEVPALEQDVPRFSAMLKGKQPAKELIYNVLDLVYVYVYICRRYNGEIDHMFSTQECAEALLAVSPVLGRNQSYDSTPHALATVLDAVSKNEHVFVSHEYSVTLLADAALVLNAEAKVGAALSHLYRVFGKAATESKAAVMVPKLRETRRQIKMAAKKLLFFISWWYWLCSEEAGDGDDARDGDGGEGRAGVAGAPANMAGQLLSVLRSEIERERAAMTEEFDEVSAGKTALETAWNGPRPADRTPLIQEL